MKKVTLADFVALRGYSEAARHLGCSSPAIIKALSVGREIYVRRKRGGFEAEEVRPFPSQERA